MAVVFAQIRLSHTSYGKKTPFVMVAYRSISPVLMSHLWLLPHL